MSFFSAIRDWSRSVATRAAPVALAGALGALAWGLTEALRLRAGASFLPDPTSSAILVAAGGGTALPVGLAFGALLGLCVGRLSLARRIWAGVLGGATAMLAWDLAQRWFTDPGPSGGLPLQGNPAVAAVLGLALAAVLGVAIWRVRRGLACALGIGVVALGLCGWYLTGLPRGVERPAPRPGAPNVLWVTLDTVRADHTSPWGGRAATPALERLAAEGVLFEKAFSPIAVTGPSHTALFTGAGPWRTGSLLNAVPILPELTTLPEALRQAGYRTGAFVSAWVLQGEFGFARGFDLYDDELGAVAGLDQLVFFRTLAMVRRRFDPDRVVERRGDRTADRALSWLAAQQEPWFLWVHFFDPHGPYEPPAPLDAAYWSGADPRGGGTPVLEQLDVAPYLRESLRGVTSVDWIVAQYDGEISFADQQLGRLLDDLDRRGLAASTLVVVNADHGEDLGEHGVWFEHGDGLYDSATHVPLAIRLPGGALAGTRVDDPVELSDLAPTVLDFLGVRAPATMQGRSLRDAMTGKGHRIQARGLCLDRPANQAARAAGQPGSWRIASLRAPQSLFVHRDSPEHPDEYYDLVADPSGERSALDLRLADPDGAQLMGLLEAQADGLLRGMGQDLVQHSEVELTDEQTEALKTLGYIE